ncbi:MAG: hypothetical protein Q7S03_04210 [bacterium]|nr:hypothetical protein [bacterium]
MFRVSRERVFALAGALVLLLVGMAVGLFVSFLASTIVEFLPTIPIMLLVILGWYVGIAAAELARSINSHNRSFAHVLSMLPISGYLLYLAFLDPISSVIATRPLGDYFPPYLWSMGISFFIGLSGIVIDQPVSNWLRKRKHSKPFSSPG